MIVRRLVVGLLVGGAVMVVTAAPAFAHARLVASTPAEGAALAAAPRRVELTFNEPVTPAPDSVVVSGPDGVSWTVGAATAAGAVVTVPVRPSGPAGAYTLTYRVLSADGDTVSGDFQFTLTAAVPAPTTTTEPTTTASTTTAPPVTTTSEAAAGDPDDGGIPTWVWIVGGVLVLVAGLLISLALSRGPRRR